MINVLVVNDDGILSEGLLTLANVFIESGYNVTVVAPDGNRSGFSHSISFYRDIFFKEYHLSDKFKAYTISGTPVDCVKFARHYLKEKFDLVVSGINLGPNLGGDTMYSGTVNACLEACYLGIKSIAFSNIAHKDYNLKETGVIIKNLIPKLYELSGKDYILNVNIPNLKANDILGIKFAKVGIHYYTDAYEKMDNGAYQLTGASIMPTEEDYDTDVYYAFKGYVTVTPLKWNLTDIDNLKLLKEKGI